MCNGDKAINLLLLSALQAYQGAILSAFFAGYAATQVLGGELAVAFPVVCLPFIVFN